MKDSAKQSPGTIQNSHPGLYKTGIRVYTKQSSVTIQNSHPGLYKTVILDYTKQ